MDGLFKSAVGFAVSKLQERASNTSLRSAAAASAPGSTSAFAGSDGTTRNVLLVFVHGFMGSGESFHRFPEDLVMALREEQQQQQQQPQYQQWHYGRGSSSTAGSVGLHTEHFEYTTSGDNSRSVAALVEFLQAKAAAATKDTDIVLLAHSMGGPLSLDAVRYLWRQSQTAGGTSGPGVAVTASTMSYNAKGASLATPRVRVRGVLSYDSPFFGLSDAVMAAGVGRATGAMQAAKPVLEAIGAASRSANAGSASASASARGTVQAGGTQSGGSSTGLALVGLAAVVGAAWTAYQSPTVRQAVHNAGTSVVERLNFLGPLWQVGDQEQRFADLSAMQRQSQLFFHGAYIELPGKQQGDGVRNFSKPPPPSLAGLFSTHKMDGPTSASQDQIEAHMHMFSSQYDRQAYVTLLSRASLRLAGEGILV